MNCLMGPNIQGETDGVSASFKNTNDHNHLIFYTHGQNQHSFVVITVSRLYWYHMHSVYI